MKLTRRGLLAGTGASALGWALTGNAGARPRAAEVAEVPTPGLPLPVLPELSLDSSGFGLLTAAPLTGDPSGIGAQMLPPALAYDGGIPGPIVRLRDGQRARIRFANRTGAMSNLHLHGLHLPPATDAPFAHVHDGGSRDYAFALPHGRPSTYWYHPHLHGSVQQQLLQGLYGPLLVDPAVLPAPLAGAEEHVVVLSTRLNQSQVLANGFPSPVLQAGATRVRLRLVNGGTMRTLNLRALGADGRPRVFWQVATDGGFLDQPLAETRLSLAAGERAEILLDVGADPVTLTTVEDHVAVLVVSGTDGPPLPPPSGRLARVERLRPPARATHRVITLMQTPSGRYLLDGKPFSEKRIDQTVGHGALEVWEVRNRTGIEHSFHLHTWPFQVLKRGGRAESLLAWRDVVSVPPRQSVQLAIRFDSFRGTTVYHCHMAMHEDTGMMGTVRVV